MVMYTMYFSFRTAVRDCALLWHSQLYMLCILGFRTAVRGLCLIMAQSVVYPMYFSFRTVVLDCALLWYSQLCILCIFRHSLNMGLSFLCKFIYSLLVHQGTRQGLK